jgi:hypothetical protein
MPRFIVSASTADFAPTPSNVALDALAEVDAAVDAADVADDTADDSTATLVAAAAALDSAPLLACVWGQREKKEFPD